MEHKLERLEKWCGKPLQCPESGSPLPELQGGHHASCLFYVRGHVDKNVLKKLIKHEVNLDNNNQNIGVSHMWMRWIPLRYKNTKAKQSMFQQHSQRGAFPVTVTSSWVECYVQ